MKWYIESKNLSKLPYHLLPWLPLYFEYLEIKILENLNLLRCEIVLFLGLCVKKMYFTP